MDINSSLICFLRMDTSSWVGVGITQFFSLFLMSPNWLAEKFLSPNSNNRRRHHARLMYEFHAVPTCKEGTCLEVSLAWPYIDRDCTRLTSKQWICYSHVSLAWCHRKELHLWCDDITDIPPPPGMSPSPKKGLGNPILHDFNSQDGQGSSAWMVAFIDPRILSMSIMVARSK